jgi:hypothetical protein
MTGTPATGTRPRASVTKIGILHAAMILALLACVPLHAAAQITASPTLNTPGPLMPGLIVMPARASTWPMVLVPASVPSVS